MARKTIRKILSIYIRGLFICTSKKRFNKWKSSDICNAWNKQRRKKRRIRDMDKWKWISNILDRSIWRNKSKRSRRNIIYIIRWIKRTFRSNRKNISKSKNAKMYCSHSEKHIWNIRQEEIKRNNRRFKENIHSK